MTTAVLQEMLSHPKMSGSPRKLLKRFLDSSRLMKPIPSVSQLSSACWVGLTLYNPMHNYVYLYLTFTFTFKILRKTKHIYPCIFSYYLSSEHVRLDESTLEFCWNKNMKNNLFFLVPLLLLLAENMLYIYCLFI